MLQSKLISDRDIIYTGEQLRSHWIYETFDICGNAVVAFCGEVDVKIDKMVDIQDVKGNAGIYSTRMLNFIVELFGVGLQEAILWQRMFICIIQDHLNTLGLPNRAVRDGDDLYYEGGKLSVSIATVSRVSALIHIGLNVDSANAPVRAAGLLSEMNIKNINELAFELMKRYTIEHQQIEKAGCKVKPV